MVFSLPKHFGRVLALNYLAWMVYFIVYVFYAYFWRQYSENENYQYTLQSSLLWFAKEWAVWLVISPMMLWVLESTRFHAHARIYIGLLMLFSLIAALLVRVALRSGEYSSSWAATVTFTLPKYIPACIVIIFCWTLYRRTVEASANAPLTDKTPTNKVGTDAADTFELQVEHKGLSYSLTLQQIIYLRSAGNYVEIYCDNATYLRRCTLKQLLESLPESRFMQVHRSYAVNLSKLETLNTDENGSTQVTLTGQHSIPVSKRYKRQLKSISLSDSQSFKN